MSSKITRRIEVECGIENLAAILGQRISPGDLQSLLLDVYERRAADVTAPGLLTRSMANALTAPSSVDARLLSAFDRAAFAVADRFEAVELSPAGPLGASRILGEISQNSLLTTIRNAEVLGDSTPALALECARRRKNAGRRVVDPEVRLCASHRVIRLQPFDSPGFTPHFRLFTLVSAGRDRGSSSFEIRHLREHISFYLELFRVLNQEGFSFTKPLVELSDLRITGDLLQNAGVSREEIKREIRAHWPGGSERFLEQRGIRLPAEDPRLDSIRREVVAELQGRFPEAEFRFNLARLEGLNYYTGLCLRISPEAPDGVRYSIADGGFTNWTARMLEDRKERLLTSGIGSEFVCRKYRVSSQELRDSATGSVPDLTS